jgi:hypothetical protein
MTIQVEQRNVYGSIKFYPVNELAEQFAQLMKQKTFDAGNLRDIKRMGIDIEVQVQSIKF